jgi:GDP-L-fucose synthase
MGHNLSGKKVLVTGGAGFLGSHLVPLLEKEGASEIIPTGWEEYADYDLVNREDTHRMYEENQPDMLIHLAAAVGGIEANRRNPGRFFYLNMAMGINVIEEARIYGIEKILVVGTTCGYPKHAPTPFVETDFFNGYPEETNAPYGIAKRALLVMAQSYRQQYGLNAIYLIPANLYGPRDNFDYESSHVIPALIRKFVEARESGAESMEAWGTGEISREFLHVDDCARACVMALDSYNDPEPVNIATGDEIKIKDLVELIRQIVGYEGEIVWDASRPDGQPKRRLDTARAKERFGFEAEVPLEEGIRKTVDWFVSNRSTARGVNG